MSYLIKLFHAVWLSSLLLVTTAHAQLAAIPPNVQSLSAKPMVMLNMSRDHQLFYRAYNEYSDINFDGTPDTTYNHTIDYYGYFDAFKCYDFSVGSNKFTPAFTSTDKYCNRTAGSIGQWSGNFLNWATMTRIDVVRKVLYGGFRSTDTASSTVLERSYLPTDAHAFAKYYNGADLIKLTPFTPTQLATRTMVIKGTGNWWESGLRNYTQTMAGITICNTTLGSTTGADRYSQTNTQPPLMRVAFGDFSLWNANERWQCNWSEEGHDNGGNGNQPSITGLKAAPRDPNRDPFWIVQRIAGTDTWTLEPGVGLTVGTATIADYTVRVDSCVAGLIGQERCKEYPSGNFKPIGLLHEFGESDKAEFGMITGSFMKNISGGVLRRNVQTFKSEVNYTTTGVYTAELGIVNTLNKLRIYGYDYSDGTYQDIDSNGNWCTYQLTGLTDNQCTSWGNPLGEMYLETLRYLGGKTVSSAFDYTDSGSKDATLGLSKEVWVDPFLRSSPSQRTAVETTFGKAQCRPINILNFNASVISYDKDNNAGFSDLTSTTLDSLLTTIGAGEGINGTSRLVGSAGAATNKLCDAKTVNSLADVEGLCPDAPAYKGSYALAGMAYWAHTNKIRTDIATTQPKAFKADTYSVALSPGAPRIVVVSQTDPTKKVIIQPAYRLNLGGSSVGGGTMVDFRIVTQTPTYGKYLVVWEDSEQGGDYDQDVTGTLEYQVVGNNLTVKTYVFAAATANPQGFGYVISGTAGNDGAHFHSGILGFNYTDSTNISVSSTNPAKLNASGGCVDCQVYDPPTTAAYTIAGGNTGALEDPLYFAAKWGGFTNSTNNATATPSSASLWDVKRQDGTPGADGVPDNYFVVFRPDLLEGALRQVFTAIVSSSNAAPAVSRPDLRVGDFKYVARFDSTDLRGEIDAYQIQSDGTFSAAPTYRGHQKLGAISPSLRQVITNVGTTGVAFNYTSINSITGGTTYTNSLSTNGTLSTAMINYMRGDRTNEEPAGLRLRARNANSIMGGVINSSPWVQDRPTANYFGAAYPGYGAFRTAQNARDRLVWIGANDGMLHGFKSTNLDPVMSYVPGQLAATLKNTTDKALTNATAYMDGSPFTADVIVSGTSTWATYLFSSMGRGQKGVFTLDVTNTSTGLTQGNAASIFKWQYPKANTTDVDFGYILSENGINPLSGQASSVAKLRNGKFAVMYGNGVQSASGKAALYIFFVSGPTGASGTWTLGTDYIKITTPSAAADNGLMQPFWVDTNGDNIADAVYAGDLKGNMWKFDLSSTTTSNWKVAYNTPLYSAKDSANNPLPITSSPAVQFHPLGGQMVVFGTGQSIFYNDFPDTTRTQRVYGIWDKPSYATNTSTIASGLTELQPRTWTINPSTNGLVQTGTTARVDWTTKKGYYADIPYSSGMVVSNVEYARDGSNDVGIFIIIPSTAAEECNNSAKGIYVQIEPVDGVQYSDLFGNGDIGLPIDGQRGRVSRDFTGSGGNCIGANCPCVGPTCTPCVGPTCGPPAPNCQSINTATSSVRVCRPNANSRLQWREIPGLITAPN
jgi:type IV pilus assembly protein PilY1